MWKKSLHALCAFMLMSTMLWASPPKHSLSMEGSVGRHPITLTGSNDEVSLCNIKPGVNYSVMLVGSTKAKIVYQGKKVDSVKGISLKSNSGCTEFSIEGGKAGEQISLTVVSSEVYKPKAPANKSAVLSTTSAVPLNTLVEDFLLDSDCFAVFNVSYSGGGNRRGSFSNGATNIGIADGLILGTGDINTIPIGPNDQSGATDSENLTGSDSDLDILLPGYTKYDISILEFDFVPTNDFVSFDYVFASEEYCEYVNSSYNDVFGFFLSGPGISGNFSNNAINIAQVPGSNDIVSINSINHLLNTSYFINNMPASFNSCSNMDPGVSPGIDETQFDGFTTVLTASSQVVPGGLYHIKLAIANSSDGILESSVFLKGNSFDGCGDDPLVFGFKIDDANCNGIWDEDENAIPNWPIQITDASGNTTTIYTDDNGYYYHPVSAGSFIVAEGTGAGCGWVPSSPSTVQVSVSAPERVDFFNCPYRIAAPDSSLICVGESYTWNGRVRGGTGTYNYTLKRQNGTVVSSGVWTADPLVGKQFAFNIVTNTNQPTPWRILEVTSGNCFTNDTIKVLGGVPHNVYFDADLDGFGDESLDSTACWTPADMMDIGGDCNDWYASINPQAEENCGNYVDDDCDDFVDLDDPDVQDTLAPYLYCYNTTVWVTEGCLGIMPSYYSLGSAGDDCSGNVTVFSDPEEASSLPLGINTFTLTAYDQAENMSTCDGTVNVVIQPAISCPADITVQPSPECSAPMPDMTTEMDIYNACEELKEYNLYQYPGVEATLLPGPNFGYINIYDGDTYVGVCYFNITLQANQYYSDYDGDGFGSPYSIIWACEPGEGAAENCLDCYDGDATIYPGAPELEDSYDNDCNGIVDDICANVNIDTIQIVHSDTGKVWMMWPDMNGATVYNIQYRKVGTITYTTVGSITNNVAEISGLMANTSYEFRIRTKCGATFKPYSANRTFTTMSGTGTCGKPINLKHDLLSQVTTRLYWNFVPGVKRYRVRYRPSNVSTWTTKSVVLPGNATAPPTTSITGLTPGQEYIWQVQALCPPYLASNWSAYSTPLAYFTMPPATLECYPLETNLQMPEHNIITPEVQQDTKVTSSLMVSPNPVLNEIKLLYDGAEQASIQILDATGRLVLANANVSNGNTLDVSSLPTGLYMVRATFADKQVATTRLVKM